MSVSHEQTHGQERPTHGNSVKMLDDVAKGDLLHVGGKALNVARLRSAGFDVPDGFVLVGDAFLEFATIEHAASFLDEVRGLGADIERINAAVASAPEAVKGFLREVDRDLALAAQSVSPAVGTFATRSSACEEDSAERSFAGIYVTTLGVRPSELTASVLRLWASYQSERARAYRGEGGEWGIAALIQEMVPCTKAGVAFSANPLSGSTDEVFVEAAWGLGKLVVGSRPGRDIYRVDKQSLSPIDIRVGKKDARLTLRAGRLVERAVPTDAREQRVLSDDDLRELSSIVKSVEHLFDGPQDLEWCYCDGKVWLVQTRPITYLPPAGRDVEWSRQPYLELFPEVPRPMTTSYIEQYWARWQEEDYRARGLFAEHLGPASRIVYGRPVLNLTLLKTAVAAVGVPPPIVLRSIGQSELGVDQARRGVPVLDALRRIPRLVRLLLQVVGGTRVARGAMRSASEFRRRIAPKDVSLLSEKELLQTIEESRPVDKRLMRGGDFVMEAIPVRLVQADWLLNGRTDSVEDFLNATTAVGTKEPTAQEGIDLLQLAHIARSDPRLLAYFVSSEAYPDYRERLAGSDFLRAFDSFMEKYGHRAVFEIDPSLPRYAENPQYILSTVATYLRSDEVPFPESLAREREGQAQRHWDELISRLTGFERTVPVRLWLIRRTVRTLKNLFVLRGQVRDEESALVADVRRYDLALAEKLTLESLLNRPDDYFWLRVDEVRQAVRPTDFRDRLKDTVEKRKHEHEVYRAISVPNVFRESEIPLIALTKVGAELPEDSGYLHGTPISPGSAQGEIVVMDDPADLRRLKKGAILFTREVDPSWVPAFGLIEGIVTETGGILSHGAIAVREYGLPAIANVPDATRRAMAWKTARIDGSTGTIELGR